ncbi:MAG TPA: hypothetical protein PK869_11320 [Candidatus Hydrogenedentes bacterium]|nr:hypothetical protein [Candidatus Hydrogenedentota bacterium]
MIAALMNYQEKEGFLPYDPKGAPHALYGLLDYTKGIEKESNEGVWYIESLDLLVKITEKAPSFDHESRQMLDCPYEYINTPNTRIALTDDPIVILARIDESGGRPICEYITSSAQYFKVVLRDGHPTASEFLGLPGASMPAYVAEVIDICIDDPRQWLRGEEHWTSAKQTIAFCERRDFRIPYDTLPEYLEARIGIERMFQALAFYLRDTGSFPYDSRGADYALYKLKPYFPKINNKTNRLRPPIQFDIKLGRVSNDRYFYINRFPYGFHPQRPICVLIDLQRYPLNKTGLSISRLDKPVNRVLYSFGQCGLVPAFESASELAGPDAWKIIGHAQLIPTYYGTWWEGADRFYLGMY